MRRLQSKNDGGMVAKKNQDSEGMDDSGREELMLIRKALESKEEPIQEIPIENIEEESNSKSKDDNEDNNEDKPDKEKEPKKEKDKDEMPGEIERYSFDSGGIPVTVRIIRKPTDYVPQYIIQIPLIAEGTKLILNALRADLITQVKLEVTMLIDPRQMKEVRSKFEHKANELLEKQFTGLTPETRKVLTSYLLQHTLGLGELEILMADDNLEDIAINSPTEPIRVYHKRRGWCDTNLWIKRDETVYEYAAIIGRRVGRQINVLNPIMNAYLANGDRVNATLAPISSFGNTLSIRKFAKNPWTIPYFIELKTISVEMAALTWLCIQNEISLMSSGGTGSGKTSFLNAMCCMIPPNQRIISIEDSVSGDSEMVFETNGEIRPGTVAELIDEKVKESGLNLPDGAEIAYNDGSIRIPSMTPSGKIELAYPRLFIRHHVKRKMLRIKLASGREVSITPDHSLFALSRNNDIRAIAGADLKIGSFIATPRRMDYEGRELTFNLLEHAAELNCMLYGEPIAGVFANHSEKLPKKFRVRHYKDHGCLPAAILKDVGIGFAESDAAKLRIAGMRLSNKIPAMIEADTDLCTVVGLWLADGSYDKNSIILSVDDEESRAVVRRFAERMGITVRMHSDGISLMLNSRILKDVFVKVLGLSGNAYTKQMPKWIYGLPKDKVAALLKGYFSGDGRVSNNELSVTSCSIKLLKSVQTLLLRFGIVLRISEIKLADKTYDGRVSSSEFASLFETSIGFLQHYKQERLAKVASKTTKAYADVIPLAKPAYIKLKHSLGDQFKQSMPYTSWKSWQGSYVGSQKSNIGRQTLQQLIKHGEVNNNEFLQTLQSLATNDIFWDRVVSLEEYDFDGHVYDFSVPKNESFVCNNIVAHNTRELTLPDSQHWIAMTTREPNLEGKGEITMLELMINALRQRPDRIIVGEVRRQREAEVLFEAMHTGHSVYATIHADNAEQCITRLTTPPINLPKSTLTALGGIIVQYRNRRTGVRRSFEFAEITNTGEANVVYRWDPKTDVTKEVGSTTRLGETLALYTGMTAKEMKSDLNDKVKILKWMGVKKYFDINAVGRIAAEYYRMPDDVINIATKNIDWKFD